MLVCGFCAPIVLSTKVSTMIELLFELVSFESSRSLMSLMFMWEAKSIFRRKAWASEFRDSGFLKPILDVSTLKDALVFMPLILLATLVCDACRSSSMPGRRFREKTGLLLML